MGEQTGKHGFSTVELLIVVAVTSVGFVALLELQVASIRGLGYPAKLTLGMGLGEHFLGTLQTEAVEWTDDGGPNWSNSDLRYLSQFNEAAPDEWILASAPEGVDFALTDSVGSDLWYDGGVLREIPPTGAPRFCLHYRLSWATPNQSVIRADVRVSWLHDEASWSDFKDCPDEMFAPENRGSVTSVRLSELIMRNTAA